jgi:hypothetical protein
MRYVILLAAVLGAISIIAPETAQGSFVSVSGRVIALQQGQAVDLTGHSLFVAPADVPQPFVAGSIADSLTSLDSEGNFLEGGLAEGDYFIFPDRALMELGTFSGLPDTVTITDFEGGPVETRPALQVSLAAGEDLTGIEIIIEVPEECLLDAPCPLSGPLSPIVSPESGSGTRDGNAGAYLGAAIAGAAVVLLGGGIAMRVRQRRRSA